MNCNNTIKFILKSTEIHSGKYDYSKTEYKNNKIKVKIICPTHGEFEQSPSRHLEGREGCINCNSIRKGNSFRKPIEKFINQAVIRHNRKYDYSKTEYKNNKIKVKIICPTHGEFEQSPCHHINGHGCPACSNCLPITKDYYIKKANKVHNNKYQYHFNTINGAHSKIEIICSDHGLFLQIASSHLNGAGCPACSRNKRLSNDEFLIECFKVHGDKYDYSNVKYIKNKSRIEIGCPYHGIFFQLPWAHRGGSGCPKCKSSHGERLVRKYLENQNINFEEQKKFKNCKYKKELSFDFYIPDKNILIEYQGEHHFPPKNGTRIFGASDPHGQYKLVIIRDKIKKDWCIKNDKILITISYKEIDMIQYILRRYDI